MMKFFDLQLFGEEEAAAASTIAGEDTAQTPTEKQTNQPGKENKAEPKYTDEDLDRIIGRKFAEMEKKKQKEVDEAKKMAAMNATEKANYERDQAIKERDDAFKERDEIKAQMALADMANTARKMLADEGIAVSDALLSIMVTADAEETKAAIDNFTKLFKESVESAVKDRLRGETPRRSSGSDTPISEIDKRIKKYL